MWKRLILSRRFSTKVKPPKSRREAVSREVLTIIDGDDHRRPESRSPLPELPDELNKRLGASSEVYAIGWGAVDETTRVLSERLLGGGGGEASAPLLEVNPGPGRLTRALLGAGFPFVHLFEANVHFEPTLKLLQSEYPDRVNYSIVSFFTMWRAAFLDKKYGTSGVENMLKNLERKPWGRDISMNVVGAIPSLNFIVHLLDCIIHQDSIVLFGRPEFYVWLNPSDYYSLRTDESCEHRSSFYYRQKPVLYNILFDDEILAKASQTDFMPNRRHSKTNTVNKNKSKISDLDADHMYLVHMKPKESLPCAPESLPLLWFFCKHHLRSKTGRIIPSLEQWIPGCGVWLITGQDPPGTCSMKGPSENDQPLPHMTIFSRFSDLTPKQTLTLFKKFISWPEFEQCPFRESLENHMYRGLAQY